jgi:hypothetical protein
VSASQRRKGASGELEAARILTDALGVAVKRKLGQARDGGDDIQIGRYRIEVKRRERLSIDEWSAQVEACAAPGEVPVVLYRRNGQPWRVCLRLDDWIPMLRDAL